VGKPAEDSSYDYSSNALIFTEAAVWLDVVVLAPVLYATAQNDAMAVCCTTPFSPFILMAFVR
jgi:hypothetical protein